MYLKVSNVIVCISCIKSLQPFPASRLRLKCDSTRTEIRILLSAKRTSPFKLAVASVQSTTDSRGVRISGSNAGYTMFRGSVKSTGYRLHSPVSHSLSLPCVTMCHHISTGLYQYVAGTQERNVGCSRSLQFFPVLHRRGEIFKYRLLSTAQE